MTTYIVTFPVTTCEMCGQIGIDHSAVMFARGSYCRSCAPIAVRLADQHNSRQNRKGLLRALAGGVWKIGGNTPWHPSDGAQKGEG